jgi:hypothetical protein
VTTFPSWSNGGREGIRGSPDGEGPVQHALPKQLPCDFIAVTTMAKHMLDIRLAAGYKSAISSTYVKELMSDRHFVHECASQGLFSAPQGILENQAFAWLNYLSCLFDGLDTRRDGSVHIASFLSR